jgi:hypothetical protein
VELIIKVMPVIIGAIGTMSKLFRKYLNNVPGRPNLRNCTKQP